MKKMFFLLIGFASATLFAQDNEQKAIDELKAWHKDYQAAMVYYNEIKDSKEESPEICKKASEAYRLLQSSIQHCETAKNYYPEYSKDVAMYMTDTYLGSAEKHVTLTKTEIYSANSAMQMQVFSSGQ